ncbi:unnamed protein product [Zymoseptoria tritici ST99CH_1E4]|uniref:Uncharacterized protein n=1 Tax=Zymoseptoria tritici ST99CH_1E4 TaxID=1276532 RepID=A0A2H1H8R6_ZYMTR|nr:unnamed protein product [Zymoseptoria tritici ST99CH_1E4]
MADPTNDRGTNAPNNQHRPETHQAVMQRSTQDDQQLNSILQPLAAIDMKTFTSCDPHSQLQQWKLHAAKAKFVPDLACKVMNAASEQLEKIKTLLNTQRSHSRTSLSIIRCRHIYARTLPLGTKPLPPRPPEQDPQPLVRLRHCQTSSDLAEQSKSEMDDHINKARDTIAKQQREAEEHLEKSRPNHAQSQFVVDMASLFDSESCKRKDAIIQGRTTRLPSWIIELSNKLKAESDLLTKANGITDTVRRELNEEKQTTARLQGDLTARKEDEEARPTHSTYQALLRRNATVEEQLLQFSGVESGDITRSNHYLSRENERLRALLGTPLSVSSSTPAHSLHSFSTAGLSPAPQVMSRPPTYGTGTPQHHASSSSSGFPSAPPSMSSSIRATENSPCPPSGSVFTLQPMSFPSTRNRKPNTRPTNSAVTADEMFGKLDFGDESKSGDDKRSASSTWTDLFKTAVHPRLTALFCRNRDNLNKMTASNRGDGRTRIGVCAQAKLDKKSVMSTVDLGDESCTTCQKKRLVCVRSKNSTRPMAVPLPKALRIGYQSSDLRYWVLDGPSHSEQDGLQDHLLKGDGESHFEAKKQNSKVWRMLHISDPATTTKKVSEVDSRELQAQEAFKLAKDAVQCTDLSVDELNAEIETNDGRRAFEAAVKEHQPSRKEAFDYLVASDRYASPGEKHTLSSNTTPSFRLREYNSATPLEDIRSIMDN